MDWCSKHPGVAVIKAFWTDLSRYLLDSMNSSHLFFRMVVNSLPTQEVRAIGRKLEGSLGSSSAEDFPISLIPASFQLVGMVDVDQQHWKRLSKARVRDGHLLKTWYGIWSNGAGAEDDLALLMTVWISGKEIGASLNSTDGALGVGIHGGVWYSWGEDR